MANDRARFLAEFTTDFIMTRFIIKPTLTCPCGTGRP